MRPVVPSLVAVVLALVVPTVVQAVGVPLTLTTSGYLLDATDQPLTQPGVSLGFSVWTDVASPAEASRIWPAVGENACTVEIRNGFYSAVLDGSLASGCGAGLSSDHLPGTSPRYLQVSVGGVTLSPRLQLGSVPNAALATRSADAQAFIAALSLGGTSVNGDGSLVDWKALKGVPGGFADGIDADTTYTVTADGGLALDGTALKVAGGGVTNAMLAQSSLTVTPGTGLAGGGAVALGAATTLRLADTAVTPRSYAYASVTVDQQGRITAAADGAAPTGTVTSVGAGAGLTGGPIAVSGSLAIADNGVTSAMLASDPLSLARVSGSAMSTSDGNVGLGTAPVAGARLVVSGIDNSFINVTDTGTGQAGLKLTAGSGTTNRAARIDLLNAVASPTVPRWTMLNDYNQDGLNAFALIDATTLPVVTVRQGGNVGIGTTNPLAKLEVAGSTVVGSLAINAPALAATDWRKTLKTSTPSVAYRNGGSLSSFGSVTHVQGLTNTSQPDYSYYYLLLWREPVGANNDAVPFITFSGTVGASRSNDAGTGGQAAIHGGRGYNSSSSCSVNRLNYFGALSFVHNVPSNGKLYAALLHDTHTGPGILDWWYDINIFVGAGDPTGYLDDTFKSITSTTVLHTP